MKKSSSLIIISILLLFSNLLFAQGSKNNLNPEFIEALLLAKTEDIGAIPYPVKLGYDAFQPKNNTNFPEYFDLRDLGVLPPVKSQSSGGCWAYSSMSTVESRMLVLGQGLYDLSDNNLKYCHGFFDSRSTNGNAWMATAYFARQSGPLLEEQDPHPGGTSQPGVNCPQGEAPAFFVRDSRYPPGDMATIKELIMNVGSVWSLIYYNSAYFNDADDTYYYTGTNVNHVFNIVGWDDNKVTAGGTGAWICQNTYGPNWGENGFVYVSYNDASMLQYNAYFPTFDVYNDNSRVLLYDELGNYDSYGYDSEEGYALVKYPIYENLFVDQIGTYAMAYGTQIGIEIYGGFDENSGVLSEPLGAVSNQTTDHPGYYTFNLDNSFPVYAGDEIFLKVSYMTPSYDYPIPIELFIDTYSDPFIETGVSWISPTGDNGSWEAIGSDTPNNFDLCINVYGQFNPQTIPLSNAAIWLVFGGLVIVYLIRRVF
jgi:C1A family cysteine protease